jgi:hypothetical protein
VCGCRTLGNRPLRATAAKGSVTCISSKHKTAALLWLGMSHPKLTSPSLPLIKLWAAALSANNTVRFGKQTCKEDACEAKPDQPNLAQVGTLERQTLLASSLCIVFYHFACTYTVARTSSNHFQSWHCQHLRQAESHG